MTDKRTLLGIKNYSYRGQVFPVYFYLKKSGRGQTVRQVYGTVEMYITKKSTADSINKLLIRSLDLNKNNILDRPFYKEDEYIYVLGKKKNITRDPLFKKNNEYFFISDKCKDPISVYKKRFISYLKNRMLVLGKMMHHDLSSYRIQSAIFLTYFGCIIPSRKTFKFDFRLFAYKEEILDSVLIHEIAHIDHLNHSRDFYNLVYHYCPDYDILDSLIKEGRFDG